MKSIASKQSWNHEMADREKVAADLDERLSAKEDSRHVATQPCTETLTTSLDTRGMQRHERNAAYIYNSEL